MRGATRSRSKRPTLVKPGEDDEVPLSAPSGRRASCCSRSTKASCRSPSYRTPDPLGHFFQKRALEVSTTADSRSDPARVPAAGARRPRRAATRKACSASISIRSAARARSRSRTGRASSMRMRRRASSKYAVPDYFNGTLRVMAVAVADDRVGVHDGRTLVRGDFVLSPNAPTTVTPGDEFDVSVGVSNNVEGSGANAAGRGRRSQTDKALEVVGERTQQATIAEGHESSVRFRLRARDELGPRESDVQRAHRRRAGASRRIDLSIRPATPYMTQTQGGRAAARRARDAPSIARCIRTIASSKPASRCCRCSSRMASSAISSNYPYACTEQIVSQAMPAVLLASRPEFGYVRNEPGADIGGLDRRAALATERCRAPTSSGRAAIRSSSSSRCTRSTCCSKRRARRADSRRSHRERQQLPALSRRARRQQPHRRAADRLRDLPAHAAGTAHDGRDRRCAQAAGRTLSRPVGTGSHCRVAGRRARSHAPGSRCESADRPRAVRCRHDQRASTTIR